MALRLFLLAQKKSTHGIPDGLPSVALAKDGGGYKKDLKNSLDLKIGKVFQEWCLMQFDEIFSENLSQAEHLGRLFVVLQSAQLKFTILEYG